MLKGIVRARQTPVSIKVMLERVSQRRIAAGCPRCGGTGSFSTVDFPGIGSRYGSACFDCGEAWKLPSKWSSMTPKEILDLFEDKQNDDFIRNTINDFVDVKILSQDKANSVLDLLNKQHETI